jgi:transposase
MKFKELTDEIIEKARQIYTDKNISWDNRMTQLTDLFGRSERTVRKWCSEKLGFKEKSEVEPEQYTQAKTRVFDKEKKRFIITWAQNNTPVHTKFLKNIEKYAEFIEADIHVIAGRYKNPTSVWTNQQESEECWDDKVVKYLDANRHDIHKYVSILSDIKIPPTAVNPMTGMQALSGVNSCVFGSPKVQMEMIPVLDGNAPKMMLTTGSVTMQNYTDSKSGKVGEFHHTFGFVVVEINHLT